MSADRASQTEADADAVQESVHGRAQLTSRPVLAKRVIEKGQDAARTVLVDGSGSQRVTGQPCDCRRARTLPAHVADDDYPAAVAGLEHVVEVTANPIARANRSEPGR